MTTRDLTIKLAMIVSTLGDSTEPGQAIPASTIYLALNSSLEDYNLLAGVGTKMGWLKTTPRTVSLTAAGRVKAKAFQALGI